MLTILTSQLIQDEIKALVQLQNRQSSAQPSPSGTAKILAVLENETEAFSPSKVTSNPQESSDEGQLTVQSSGYGTLSTWEPGTTTGSLEGKDETWPSRNKQDRGTSHSLVSKKQGQDSKASRIMASNNSPSSTVPVLPSDKQRPNR